MGDSRHGPFGPSRQGFAGLAMTCCWGRLPPRPPSQRPSGARDDGWAVALHDGRNGRAGRREVFPRPGSGRRSAGRLHRRVTAARAEPRGCGSRLHSRHGGRHAVSPRSVRILVLVLAASLGCRSQPEPDAATPDPGPQLAALVSAAVGDGSSVRGAALALESPKLGLRWEGAAGLADPAGGTAMTPATPVRIASNTKTFVAAAILRLVEEGRLGLDDPVAGLLPAEGVALLREDGYDPERILVRHLLTHTSGLFDHTGSPRYEERITSDPTHRWTPLEQLEAAMEWGQPLAAPGEVFSYCDTGYVLLGLILERATGRPLAAAVRELVGFERARPRLDLVGDPRAGATRSATAGAPVPRRPRHHRLRPLVRPLWRRRTGVDGGGPGPVHEGAVDRRRVRASRNPRHDAGAGGGFGGAARCRARRAAPRRLPDGDLVGRGRGPAQLASQRLLRDPCHPRPRAGPDHRGDRQPESGQGRDGGAGGAGGGGGPGGLVTPPP